jgi:hypothetical protein
MANRFQKLLSNFKLRRYNKAIAHNAYVKGISIGQCATSPSDQELGRHQFSDASCKIGVLGPGCLGGSSMCRFCQLSTAKGPEGWPTCPVVVCKKWKLKKKGGCEAPLELVEVGESFRPSTQFDVESPPPPPPPRWHGLYEVSP